MISICRFCTGFVKYLLKDFIFFGVNISDIVLLASFPTFPFWVIEMQVIFVCYLVSSDFAELTLLLMRGWWFFFFIDFLGFSTIMSSANDHSFNFFLSYLYAFYLFFLLFALVKTPSAILDKIDESRSLPLFFTLGEKLHSGVCC